MNNKAAILFGGTFNPFTIAHLEMVKRLRAEFPEADIVIMPTNLAFIKHWKELPGGEAFSGEDRAELIGEAVKDIPGCIVSDAEASGRLSGKSYETVAYLKESYRSVRMCVGTDKLVEMPKWYSFNELMELVDGIVCFERLGTVLDENSTFEGKITKIPFDFSDVSSTRIRELFSIGKMNEIQPMVPQAIYRSLLEKRRKMNMYTNTNFDAEKVTNDLCAWIREWFDKNGRGCNAIIGISGGKDSTVCAALCARALGTDRVVGVMMPNGIQADIGDSVQICEHLGIKNITINIADAFQGEMKELEKLKEKFGVEITPQTIQNLPPRLRMSTLYAVGQSMNGRVINTCNMSEDYVGYSTRYGDSAGDVSLLANLTVDEVKQMGRFLQVPVNLVEKAPSDGLCGKTDEDNLGFTYNTLDRYIRTGVCEDPEIKAKIDRRHELNLFKLQLMPAFPYSPADQDIT